MLRLEFSHVCALRHPVLSWQWQDGQPKQYPILETEAHERSGGKALRLSPFCIFFAFCFFAAFAGAQVAPGFPSFVPQDCHEVDCVDLLNNNITLTVPVRSKSGAIGFSSRFTQGFSVYASGGSWQPPQSITGYMGLVINRTGFGLSWFALNSTSAPCPAGGGSVTKYTGISITDGTGTAHPLPTSDAAYSYPCTTSLTDTTIDGSGFTVTIVGGAITSGFDSGGEQYEGSSNVITDSNGNQISYARSGTHFTTYTITDSMGLTALTLNTIASTTTETAYWEDVAGATRTVTQTVDDSETIQSDFGCSGIAEYDTAQTGSLLTGISFPDGTSLGLTYEGTPYNAGHYTGRINQITLREGGTVSYTYGGSNNGINCTYQTVPVLTRKLGNGDTTTYTLAYSLISGSNYKATNTMVDPGGNKTVYTFTGLNSAGNQTPPVGQFVTEVQRYQGTSALLTTDLYSYNTAFTSTPSASSISTATNSYPITKLIVYHQISGMTTYSATDTHFDAYGNVTYSAEYDFGGTSPVRATTITYGSCTANCTTTLPTISNLAMAANYIYNKRGEVVVTQNGSNVAQATYTYSSTGNLTSTQLWNGSAFVGQTTLNTYNTNGTIATYYDLNNNETTYTYAGGSYSDIDGCSGLVSPPPLPTQIKNVGTTLTTSATYDCQGGVKLTDVDANGNTTTYGYATSSGAADPYWRLSSVSDPYSSVVYKTYPTGSYDDSYTSAFTFNSGNSVHNTTAVTDQYGRFATSQTLQGPGSAQYDTLTTSYGWSGTSRQISTSQPCSVAAGSNCTTVHTSEYDPLGRLLTASTTSNETLTHIYGVTGNYATDLAQLSPAPAGENVKQTLTFYDGLGRVTSVCHIGSTASTGSGTPCATGSSYNGAVDAYAYGQGAGYTTVTVTRGSQTRTNTYDALGRLTKKVTPEGGTWTYYYDSNASTPCGTNLSRGQNGYLVCEVDPNGDDNVFYYDSLNRITDVGYGVGGSTACRRFRYDNSSGVLGSLPTGVTLSNQYGRIVEAETDTCAVPVTSTSMITDEWFNYDKDGNMLTMWEQTPHSTQYYKSAATFYAPGIVNTLQLASPSFYTMTYGLDGEGRPNTLTDTTTSQSIVTGATYYPAANPAVVSLTGSPADNDAYTYDSNTGNITQYEFSVGSTPTTLTGLLSWNQNRTLEALSVTDNFVSGAYSAYNCWSNPTGFLGYGYDDWARLVEFGCGTSNWAQQYSYDIYDNLTKSVPSGHTGTSWNPGYSSSTNHYNSPAAYDANGDVTYDGNWYYGWNQFGKMAWVNSSSGPTCGTSGRCFTYDAFGRIVETSNGSTYTERWLTQLGETANMSGATINYAYWPGPEGGTAYIGGNSSTYYWMHNNHLGSSMLTTSLTAHTMITDQAYTPYGEIYTQSGSTNSQYDVFAGIRNNTYQGVIGDTPNRELSAVGRWLSPDPAGSGWNQYAYVTNPNSQIDPLGLYCDLQQAASGCGQEGGFNEWGSDAGDPDNGPSVYSSWSGFQVNSGWVGSWQSTVGADGPGPVGSVSIYQSVSLGGDNIGNAYYGPNGNVVSWGDVGGIDASDWATYNFALGTFLAPGAGVNNFLCGDSGACSIGLGAVGLLLGMNGNSFLGGSFDAALEDAGATEFAEITAQSASIPQVMSDITPGQAALNLEANGYVFTDVSQDGYAATFTNTDTGDVFVLRPTTTPNTYGWALNFNPGGGSTTAFTIKLGPLPFNP